MGALLSIGTVAEATGLTRETIRYYERLGLLPTPTRTPSGYRQYPSGVINRLSLIRNAQAFGFSLTAIAGFLRVREAGGAPCHDVHAAAERLLGAMDTQIKTLQTTRRQMRRTLRQWAGTLQRTPQGLQARLLETLSATSARRG